MFYLELEFVKNWNREIEEMNKGKSFLCLPLFLREGVEKMGRSMETMD